MTAIPRPLIMLVVALAPLVAGTAAADGFTRQFPLQACDFKPNGGNAFFRLNPGRQLYLSNVRCVGEKECDELEEVWITVLPETRLVEFSQDGRSYAVRTRVVQEFETADGEVDEISYNFFADCDPMNDVYYFGEEVFDGEGNPEDDAWLAGVDGARPGLIMPDRAFLLGSKYYQEQAPSAKDRARPHRARARDRSARRRVSQLRRNYRDLAARAGRGIASRSTARTWAWSSTKISS